MPIDITINDKTPGTLTTLDYLRYQEGDLVLGDTKRVSANQIINPSNIVIVNSYSDLPTPFMGVSGFGHYTITEKHYKIGAHIETPYTIFAPVDYGTAVISGGNAAAGLTLFYTGTGTAFKDSNKKLGYLTFEGLTLGAINGTLVDFECDDPNIESYVSIMDCWTSDMVTIGYVRLNVSFDNWWNSFNFFDQGFTLIAATYFGFSDSWAWGNNTVGTKYFNIIGDNGDIRFSGNNFYPDTNDIVWAIDSASTVTSGTITNCTSVGDGLNFDPTGKNQTDPYWRVLAGNLVASKKFVNQYVRIAEVSAPTTSFTALNEPVPIVNTFNYGQQERFSGATDGRITYTGLEEHSSIMHSSYTIVQTTAGNDQKYNIIPAIENSISMLITSIADAGGGNIDIAFSNSHNLLIGERFTLFNMTVGAYDLTYTIGTVVSPTVLRVVGTFTTTATGEWRKLLETESKEFEIAITNEPISVGTFASIENLTTGDIVLNVVEALTDAGDPLKFYNLKNILN